MDEIRRRIREEEPPKPSTRLGTLGGPALTTAARSRQTEAPRLLAQMRGDLDWIVMRCLEKDRSRRYDTVNGLAQDLLRHLNNEPISARPPSAAYRFQKLARRHRTAFAAAAAVLVALVLGLGVATWAFFNERAARRAALVAEQAAVKSEQTAKTHQAEAERQRTEAERQREEAQTAHRLAEQRGEEMRRNLYVAEMVQAKTALLDRGGMRRMNELLEHWRDSTPDLRGWEWYYLAAQGGRDDYQTIPENGGASSHAAMSRDGRLATGGSAGIVKIWDSTGKLLATPGEGQFPSGVNVGNWSDDGRRLLIGDSKKLQVWDVASRQAVFTIDNPFTWSSLSCDGLQIASVKGTNLIITRIADGAARTLTGSNAKKNLVAWSSDGKRIATAGTNDSTIEIWNAETGLISGRFSHRSNTLPGVEVLAWSPQDPHRLLEVDRTGGFGLIDTATAGGEVTYPVKAGEDRVGTVNAAAWDSSGSLVALASSSLQTVDIYRATGEKLRTLFGHKGPVNSVGWFPNSTTRLWSWGRDGTVKFWDIAEHVVPASFFDSSNEQGARFMVGTPGISAMAWDPAGTRLAIATRTDTPDKTVRVQIADAGTRRTFSFSALVGASGATTASINDQVSSLAWSSDGKLLATSSHNNKFRVWDSETGQERFSLSDHLGTGSGALNRVCWLGNGYRLVSSRQSDANVRVWDLTPAGLQPVAVIERRGVRALSGSPDGRQILTVGVNAGGTGFAAIWDGATGRLVAELDCPSLNLSAAAWSPDGTWLAAAGLDSNIYLWDAATRQLHVLRGHAGEVKSLAWEPRGTRLASYANDGLVKIWEPTSGLMVLGLTPVAPDNTSDAALAWSPDGRQLAVISHERGTKLTVFDATPGYAAEGDAKAMAEMERRKRSAPPSSPPAP